MDEFNLDTEQTGDPVVDDRISDVEEPIVDEENDEIIGVMLRRSLVLIFFVAMVGAFVYVFVIRESEPEIEITEHERSSDWVFLMLLLLLLLLFGHQS